MEHFYQLIVMSYNSQHCILNTLQSIEYQITNYGKSHSTLITIVDDFSLDNSQKIIQNWIDNSTIQTANCTVNFFENTYNLGLKNNYLKCVSLIETSRFYIISGDDLFYRNNIYRFLDFANDYDVVFSPNITIRSNLIYYDHNFLKVFKITKDSNKVKSILSKKNPFSSSGSRISSKILLSQDFHNYYLNDIKYQEDYATWSFVFSSIKNIKIGFYFDVIEIYRPGYGRGENYGSEIKELVRFYFSFVSNVVFNFELYKKHRNRMFPIKSSVQSFLFEINDAK